MRKGNYCILFLLLALFVPGQVVADIYTYVDNDGVRHYTNVPGDKRYKLLHLSKKEPRKSRNIVNMPPRRSGGKKLLRAGIQGKAVLLRYDHHIKRAAFEHQVDPLLIKAIIKTESNFNQYAISSQGAQGLMQLMPGTAKDLAVADPFDAGENISGGTRYFRNLLDCYDGDLSLSLAAYNAGPGRVKKYGTIPRIPETVAYVKKVLHLYRAYQQGVAQMTSINVRQLVTIN